MVAGTIPMRPPDGITLKSCSNGGSCNFGRPAITLWAREDLNLRPSLYQRDAPTGLSYVPAARVGVEPTEVSLTHFQNGRTRPLCDLAITNVNAEDVRVELTRVAPTGFRNRRHRPLGESSW